ncbi:MAG: hypothetical protein QNJ36_01780 [Calothrix sp. MO_167.B42]|nr:hypothetical protein [Calothrix sp. MO_167.B42]
MNDKVGIPVIRYPLSVACIVARAIFANLIAYLAVTSDLQIVEIEQYPGNYPLVVKFTLFP